MPSENAVAGVEPERWIAGIAGGFVGGVLLGVTMDVTMPFAMEETIPAMYGLDPSRRLAWFFHQWHGVVLGAVYVVAVDNLDLLRTNARSIEASLGFGVAYGLLATLLPVLVMPLWLLAVGYQGAPPFPNIELPATAYVAAGHVVYAVPVALAYYYAVEGYPDEVGEEEAAPASTGSKR